MILLLYVTLTEFCENYASHPVSHSWQKDISKPEAKYLKTLTRLVSGEKRRLQSAVWIEIKRLPLGQSTESVGLPGCELCI